MRLWFAVDCRKNGTLRETHCRSSKRHDGRRLLRRNRKETTLHSECVVRANEPAEPNNIMHVRGEEEEEEDGEKEEEAPGSRGERQRECVNTNTTRRHEILRGGGDIDKLSPLQTTGIGVALWISITCFRSRRLSSDEIHDTQSSHQL
ncbi:hypothetical protein RB195_016641 [Necator americanus]|uniref:Uncharacterized protein n=1 Tax=Necator americanus TaxID=51031 RepID=A0ABR1C4P8_NECAM